MSIEFQLGWPCPHLTLEERVEMMADLRTLKTQKPIASLSQTRIVFNNNLLVPPEGVHTPAILTSSKSGPYDIPQGRYEIVVRSSGGVETLGFSTTKTTRYTTDHIVKLAQDWEAVAVRNDNGRLSFIDLNGIGESAFVAIEGTGASLFGFGQKCMPGHVGQQSSAPRVARGRELYPGWDLYREEGSLTERFIRFKKPVVTNPMVRVSYATSVQNCLRCRGTFTENDYRYDGNGSMVLIRNEDLLYQAALKILLTDKGSNGFFPWYGTNIRQRIGQKALSGVSSQLSEEVRTALARMQSVQNDQAKFQTVTYKERLHRVLSVDVKRHRNDPTTFLIEVVVQNASGEPVELNIVYTVPGVVALEGAKGLSMGTQAIGRK